MNYSIVVWGFDNDNYYHEIGNFSCKACSEIDAKIQFRMNNLYIDYKRYDIINVKGVKK